jgi:hypothetical protein
MNQVGQFFLSASYLVFCFFVTITLAEETTVHSYSLPDHSSIQLKAPVSWKHELQQPPNHPAPTIVFRPESKPSFDILITPLGPAAKEKDLPSLEKIKQIVQKGAEHAKLRSVEKTIQIKDLKGAMNRGYYFFATDREPEPEGYKYMTQGTIRVGALIVMFTILTNEGQDNVITGALSMLKSAVHVNDNAT